MFLSNLSNNILNFIFPSVCISCKKKDVSLCLKCFDKLNFKLKEKYDINYFYDYQNPIIKEIVKQTKYHNDKNIYKLFGDKISNFLETNIKQNTQIENIYIIPIPLSVGDKRNFNHSQILAENIAINFKYSKCKILDILIKTNTIKQAHANSRQERIENMKGKISVDKNKLNKFLNNLKKESKMNSDKNNDEDNHKDLDSSKIYIILLDDVFTTGITMFEAEKVLNQGNIQVNLKLCLAH